MRTWIGWPGRGRRERQTDLADLLEPPPAADELADVADGEGDRCGCPECEVFNGREKV